MATCSHVARLTELRKGDIPPPFDFRTNLFQHAITSQLGPQKPSAAISEGINLKPSWRSILPSPQEQYALHDQFFPSLTKIHVYMYTLIHIHTIHESIAFLMYMY